MTRDCLLTGDTLVRPLHAIAIEVCEKYELTLDQLQCHRRHRFLVLARQEFCYRAKNEARASFPQIGHFLGGRHHTTIMHACEAYEGDMWAANQQGEANGANQNG